MLCGIVVICGLEKLAMSVHTFEQWLTWKAGLFVTNSAVCALEGFGFIFIAFFISYILRGYEAD